jgi:hypothetical protein
MNAIIQPERALIADVLKELPVGAVQTWGQVELLIKNSDNPIYLFVIEIQGNNPMLQFKQPKITLKMSGETLMYHTGETVAIKKFFNRLFLPTFFVFDNYLHAYALEQRLAPAGHLVQKQKFK